MVKNLEKPDPIRAKRPHLSVLVNTLITYRRKKRCYLQKKLFVTIRDFIKALVAIIWF